MSDAARVRRCYSDLGLRSMTASQTHPWAAGVDAKSRLIIVIRLNNPESLLDAQDKPAMAEPVFSSRRLRLG